MSHLHKLCIAVIVGFMMITSVSSFGVDQLLYVFYESCLNEVADLNFITPFNTPLTILVVEEQTETKLWLNESPTVHSKHNFEQTADVIKNPKYKKDAQNVLYVPGYKDSPFSTSSQLVIEAYLKLGSLNVFALEWSTLANVSYPNAVANAFEAGTKLGENYMLLLMSGVLLKNIIIVGHDIGAHLSGQAGQTVIARSNGTKKLERITGLDPAIKLYYPPTAGVHRLSRDDATYVDVIHTDAGGYGTPKLTGTADFFVNTGRRFQPGCPAGIFLIRSDNDLCSHRRAIQLWAESISTPSSKFTATMFGNPVISSQMGYNSPKTTVPGKYVLLTNSATPFSRG